MLDCDDIVIFLVLIYPVHVHTAKKTGAGTDSNVFLNIFGSQGDSGDRPLMFSKTNRNEFEKGNVSHNQLTIISRTNVSTVDDSAVKSVQKQRIFHCLKQ